ncbi:MAG: EAL domain-containing protein [Aquamicrobium sp.]|uniref:putative bifunctional diguanylate cyclase/phosphodiesterase n=1 Tax=Aquamicrobium sp. TaxID=1872579 RepID=UPI00349EF468|nr:EAL domain-containing protein [Aquamicrobium sp.]
MSIFTTIRNHSKRGYYVLQALFAASALTLAWSLAALGDTGMLASALAFCLAVSLAAIVILYYLQRTIGERLRRASMDEIETARIMNTDALTGAMMRGAFLDELQRALGRPLAPRQATLVLVDLDHFKQLNDSFGHPFGDAALAHLVRLMGQLFPDVMIGRLGGDEFALLIRDCDIAATEARCRLLMEQLRAGMVHDGHTVSLSVSMGAALAPAHAGQPANLMLLADLALYESKANGRGRMTVFDTDLLAEKRHRRFIERELRAAIYLNELELHYQPVVNADGSTYAVEGLVRWRHPVRGLIPPGEFIPVAEATSLIDTLGAWVFRRACLDSAAFPGCRISINVSGEQLKRDEFVAMLGRVLEETGCEAGRFVLEITETAATAATPEILRRLEAARAMGFRVALDDFGTGFCGFNYLKTLPIDAIKIDRSYIKSLSHDEVARVFVSALAQIAHIQHLVIVAEGIETEGDLALARAAGCNRFQGYHIARPAPKEALAAFFRGREPVALAG